MMGEKVICYLCEKPLSLITATVDHYVPLGEGGEDRPKNYELSCKKCNNQKANLFPHGWMKTQRRKNRIPDHVRYGNYKVTLKKSTRAK